MKQIILVLSGTLSLMATSPEPFSVLDMEAGAKKTVKTTVQTVDYFINVPIELKKTAPFLLGAWDYNVIIDLHGKLQTDDPFPLEKLTMLIPKREYGFKTFLLRTYAPIKNISLKANALRNNQGNIIRKENILITRIAESVEYPAANILIPAEMKNIPDKTLAGFGILVNIPEDVPPGSYSTQVTITADGLAKQLPLNVHVPDFKLPETDIPTGCYIPYYTSDQGGKEGRWAAKDYTEARQNNYFKFCATRGLNSPTIFHYCPEFKSPDSLEMDFSTQDNLVNKIASAGSCKAILFDLRYLAAHAKRLANLKKFKDAGRDDIMIYKTLVKQFCEHAKWKKYPRFYVMAEEEIAYPSNKQKIFKRYGKHMQEVAGKNLSLILDNPQFKLQEANKDFGHLNNYRFRQYNTWLETAIRQTEKDKAEVWSYNYSYKRPSFGLLLHRLNSRGHHQWADVWGKNYTICIPADKGVISSLQYEMAHEGTIDYRCLLALKKDNTELLKELIKDIPIDNQGANLYADTLSVTQNDLLRWRAIMAQAKDIDYEKTAEGTPELKSTSIQGTNNLQTSNMVIEATHLADDYQSDAVWKGRLHQKKNNTGSLRFMLGQERRIRALSSSEEEFRKRNTPSNGNVWVTYNEHGIYLFATLNHTGYKKGIYKDDDTELWKDDCMEYFFMTPDNISYQLIVNSSDAKVLLKTGKTTDSSKIKIVSRPHESKAGGYAQEVMIPWSVFELKEKPQAGTIWRFNAGREFHSWKQYTCWARVESSFHEYSRWGTLKFSGEKQLRYLKQVKIPRLYPGTNHLSGTIPADRPLTLRLTDPDGGRTASETITPEKKQFHFQFKMMPRKTTGSYRLSVLSGDRILEEETIPVAPADSALVFNRKELACISGDTVHWLAELNLATPDIRKDTVQFRITSKDGKNHGVFPVDFTAGHSRMIWLKTGGLPPGDYRITPVLTAPADQLFPQNTVMKLKIYPAVY